MGGLGLGLDGGEDSTVGIILASVCNAQRGTLKGPRAPSKGSPRGLRHYVWHGNSERRLARMSEAKRPGTPRERQLGSQSFDDVSSETLNSR